MDFEKDDRVVLRDKHSEFDGEVGTVTQVMETMFGDATYTVSFDEGQETGVPADQLEPADDEGEGEDEDEDEHEDEAAAGAETGTDGDEA